MVDLCLCGSGRTFSRCHGDPRNAFAREQALVEARQLAALFPSVRLSWPRVLAFAERFAAQLGEEEMPTEAVLDEGEQLVDAAESRRLVEGWADAYPDRWANLVRTSGDEAAVVRAATRGALDVAIAIRGTTPRELLVELECSPVSAGPALALVLPPYLVWSYDEARAAAAAVAGRGGRFDERTRPVDEVAAALMRVDHERRVRELAALVARELPFREFPKTSRRLRKACGRVTRELEFVRGIATLLLVAYAQQLAPDRYITSQN